MLKTNKYKIIGSRWIKWRITTKLIFYFQKWLIRLNK